MCSEKTLCLSKECKNKKDCRCWCESQFTDANLLAKCKAACNANPNIRHEPKEKYIRENLCGTAISAAEVYKKSGFLCPDFDPLEETVEGKNYQLAQNQDQAAQAAQAQARKQQIALFLGLLLLLGLGVYFLNPKK